MTQVEKQNTHLWQIIHSLSDQVSFINNVYKERFTEAHFED